MFKLGRVSIVLLAVVSAAPLLRAEDKVIGAVWEVERTDIKKKWRFRAGPKGVIWSTPKEGKPEAFGTWSAKGATTTIELDPKDTAKFGPPRTITIVLVEKNPAKFQGEVESKDGKKFPLTVTLIKD